MIVVSRELRDKLYNYVKVENELAKRRGYKPKQELFIKALISQWVHTRFKEYSIEERYLLRDKLYKEEFVEKK
jgi:hypothetical protein